MGALFPNWTQVVSGEQEKTRFPARVDMASPGGWRREPLCHQPQHDDRVGGLDRDRANREYADRGGE